MTLSERMRLIRAPIPSGVAAAVLRIRARIAGAGSIVTRFGVIGGWHDRSRCAGAAPRCDEAGERPRDHTRHATRHHRLARFRGVARWGRYTCNAAVGRPISDARRVVGVFRGGGERRPHCRGLWRVTKVLMDLGRLAVRLTVGGTFFVHGTQKLFGWFGGYGPDGTGQFFESLGLRPGRRNAVVAGATEASGGILVALGLAMPLAAAGLSSVMITALRTAVWKD